MSFLFTDHIKRWKRRGRIVCGDTGVLEYGTSFSPPLGVADSLLVVVHTARGVMTLDCHSPPFLPSSAVPFVCFLVISCRVVVCPPKSLLM